MTYPSKHKSLIWKPIETHNGPVIAHTFQNLIHKGYIIALTIGDLKAPTLYTRLHSSCVTSETLRSLDCDCVHQLEGALRVIAEKGHGILFYLIQEGRGCGYVGKSRACMLVQYHDDKISTFDAYQMLGMKHDYRDYSNIREVAHMLDVENAEFVLLTNNPDKIKGFQDSGLKLKQVEAIEIPPSPYNQSYLVSKQQMGHLLYKTKTKLSRYKLPYKKIEPFVPYSLPQYSRFIHCASYYLPIKPVENSMIYSVEELRDLQAKDINIKKVQALDDGQCFVTISEQDLEKLEVRPYWFNINMYYDLASNTDYVLLSYGDFANHIPMVRVHSESLFNRFPLKGENLYKEKYKKSVQEIVKNGCGMILLLYRDGRGSGLSNFVLNHIQAEDKTGIKIDSRDYDAAVQLLSQHLKTPALKILFSGSSRVHLRKSLEKNKIEVLEWIELEAKDHQKGHQILAQRIADAPYYLLEYAHQNFQFDSQYEYIVTGIGSSEAHAKYLLYLTQKYHHSIKISYLPITGFIGLEKKLKTKLLVISQGLSPSVNFPLETWNYENVVLFTAVTEKNPNPEKKLVLDKLQAHGSQIIHFPVEDEYETLLRTIGPLAGYYHVYRSLLGTKSLTVDDKVLVRTLKDSIKKLPDEEFFNSLDTHSRIVLLVSYPLSSYFQNIVYKLEEGSFLNSLRLVDYMEFPHGSFQNTEYQLHQGKMTHFVLVDSGTRLDQTAVQKTKNMLGDAYPLWEVSSELPFDLKIMEFEMIFNYFVLKLIESKGIDQVNWFGKDRQNHLYDFKSVS